MQKLKNALINESTEQDTSIYVSDASDVPAVLSIEGNHHQKIREGYNQLNSTLEDAELNGIFVKYNNDGSVTLNGISTAATAIQISNNSVELENTDYTYFLKGKTQDFNFYVKENTGTNHTILDTSSLSEKTVMNLGNITIVGTYLYIQKNAVLNNVTVYPMLYKGTEEKEYEQYGTMPSLKYPSEIETVGENNLIQIKNINKNFYKLDISGTSRNGVDYTVENGIVTAKRTATAESGSYLNTNRTKLPAGTYVISGVDDTFVYANARIEVYTSDTIDGNATQITTLMNTRLSYKYTSDKTFYLSFSVIITGATAVNDTFIFKPQAEKNDNDTASTFVEHQEQSYVLPIQQEMLKGDYFDLENNKEVHNWNKVTLTGTENISVNLDTNDYIEFKISNVLPNTAKTEYNVTYSTHFSSTTNNRCLSYNKDLLIRIPKPNELTTAELFKTWLQENNVDVYYPLAEAIELELIENQKETLSQTNNLYLYKGTNNICTEQDLALLKLDYTVDTKTYIDNKIASNNAGGD